MRSDKKILLAFLLNLFFSIFEFVGGNIFGSVAIISDSVHDFEDSLSIGFSYFLEKISLKKPDDKYTYGYIRYSIIGSLITTCILIVGAFFVMYNAINRMLNPITINYDGMVVFAVIGVIVNFCAIYFTKDGHSLNQKTINLHMLEDVFGWLIVLIGSILMKFTNIVIIDSILSIIVAIFILISAIKNFKMILDLFLEKIPNGINIDIIKKHLLKIENVKDIHHIHIWSMDGFNNYATLHAVINEYDKDIKDKIREELREFNISHVTIEIEYIDEICLNTSCEVCSSSVKQHHH